MTSALSISGAWWTPEISSETTSPMADRPSLPRTNPASVAEFFDSYWKALALQNWSAVVLHSWRDLPGKIESDVDYAIMGPQPRELLEFLAKYSRSKGWRLVQVIEHEPNAYFCVCIQQTEPYFHLQLDVAWDYRRLGHHLVAADLLFENKRDIPGKSFQVPSAGAEFTYLLAKAAAKGKDFGDIKVRLTELLHEDREGCHRSVSRAFGEAPAVTGIGDDPMLFWAAWFDKAPCFRAVRRGRKLGFREFMLYVRRTLHPTGFLLPMENMENDESTLRIAGILAPAFRHTKIRGRLRIRDRLGLLEQLIRTTLVIEATGKTSLPLPSDRRDNNDDCVSKALEALANRIDRRIRAY